MKASYPQDQKTIDTLLNILQSPNGDTRKLTLECLRSYHKLKNGTNLDIMDISLTIEGSKPSLESAKSMAMYIRRLGASYATIPQESWVSRLVPYHLFGMLTRTHLVLHSLTEARDLDSAVFPYME